MEIPEIQPNSYKFKQEQAAQQNERERAQKVVRGSVKTQKKSELTKFASRIISDEAHNLKSHIRDDVLIPSIKDTILDIIIKGATLLFGGGRTPKNVNPLSNISYYNYGDRFGSGYPNAQPKASMPQQRNPFNYDNLVFANRGDAQLVLDQMYGTIQKYGIVTVMDLYDMADVSAPYTSDRYGWTNISTASIERVYGGYVIKLPKAMPID